MKGGRAVGLRKAPRPGREAGKPDEEQRRRPPLGKVLKRFWPFIRPYVGALAFGTVCVILAEALRKVNPLITRYLVDRVLTERVGPVIAAGSGKYGKTPLAQAPSLPLPEEVTRRKKTGFGLPVGPWVAEMLRGTEMPMPPEGLLAIPGPRLRESLRRRLEARKVPWAVAWAMLVLGRYLEETAAVG